MQQLFVTERGGRHGLVFRVHRAQQQQTGRGHAHRLAELRDGPFEPCVPEQARSDEEHPEYVPQRSGDDQNQQRHPIRHHEVEADRRDRRHHQKIERRAAQPLDLTMIDQGVEADRYQQFLQNQPADQAERKQREALQHLKILHRSRHHGIECDQQYFDSVADQHRHTDRRDMQRQRIDGVAEHGLASCRRLCFPGINTAPFMDGLLRKLPHIPDPAALHRKIDQRHTDHDSEHHARRRGGITEVTSDRPAEMVEGGAQAADRAVPAFKTDFQQCAERAVHMEHRNQQHRRETESDHILPPCDQLAVAELRRGQFPDIADSGKFRADEQRGEYDVDQKARNIGPVGVPLLWNPAERQIQTEQPDQPADYRSGQIKALEQRNQRPEHLPQHQQYAQTAERSNDNRHKRTALPGGMDVSFELAVKNNLFPG